MTFKPLGRMGVGSWSGPVLVFLPLSSAVALCFPEAFCTRYKQDCSIAQKVVIPLRNCPLQPHLGLRDKPRGDGPGHCPPIRLEAVELLSPGQACFTGRNHHGDRAVFPSGGPLRGFPSVPCFHADPQTRPCSMIQISNGPEHEAAFAFPGMIL